MIYRIRYNTDHGQLFDELLWLVISDDNGNVSVHSQWSTFDAAQAEIDFLNDVNS